MENKKKIVVVDDNDDFVTLVRGILESKGYGVNSANNGQELFSHLKNEKPDLIILDIMMPQMNGLEVLSRLKSIPETASIPVILVTAKGQYNDVLKGYQLGTDYYISKPFTSTQLLNGVNLIIGNVAA